MKTFRVKHARCSVVALAVLAVGILAIPATQAQQASVDFDSPAPPGASFDLLEGVFEGIDFDIRQWRWEGPFDIDPTNHIFFDSEGGTTRSFRFSDGPRRLIEMDAFSLECGTWSITDDNGQTATLEDVCPGLVRSIRPDWPLPSTTITVESSVGWALGITRIVSGAASPPASCPCDFSRDAIASVMFTNALPTLVEPEVVPPVGGVVREPPTCRVEPGGSIRMANIRREGTIDGADVISIGWVDLFDPDQFNRVFCNREFELRFTGGSSRISYLDRHFDLSPAQVSACRAALFAATAALGIPGCPPS